MRATEKISVSLATEDVEWARRKAEEGDKSLSAVLSDALRRQRQSEALGRLLTKLGADEIPAETVAEVRAELYGKR
jgi:hypothetical protein